MSFERDLDRLSNDNKAIAVNKINECVSLFPTQKVSVYQKLDHLPLSSGLNGYESLLFTLNVSPQHRVILTIDEAPIFEQVIFTLFQVVKHGDLDRACQEIADSLYQEILHHHDRGVAQMLI